jgi:hypothetical protein
MIRRPYPNNPSLKDCHTHRRLTINPYFFYFVTIVIVTSTAYLSKATSDFAASVTPNAIGADFTTLTSLQEVVVAARRLDEIATAASFCSFGSAVTHWRSHGS